MNLMKISSLLMGHVGEVSFVYHPKLEGYTTLMSYITKLGVIVDGGRMRNKSVKIEASEKEK